MKKIYCKIAVFFIPVLILLVMLPINRRLKFQGLDGGCQGRGIWIHDRVFENKAPIDLAFFGSSHTSNGLSDRLIQKELEDDSLIVQIANLGYCKAGRNLYYSILKEVLAEKKIKYVFMEVREDEDRYSHDIFPYVAKSMDVIAANLIFNRDFFSDLWVHFMYKVEVFQDYNFKRVEPTHLRKARWRSIFFQDTIASEKLDRIKLVRNKKYKQLSTFERNFHMHFPRYYLRKIYELCQENGAELKFLYMPAYGIPDSLPREHETYAKYGELYNPPREIFDRKSNWIDHEHLNQSGAYELSMWLAAEIKRRKMLE